MTRISHGRPCFLQRNLVLSHAAGTGAPLSDERGAPGAGTENRQSGAGLIRGSVPKHVQALRTLLRKEIYPVHPEHKAPWALRETSRPLAHLSAALAGRRQRSLAADAPARARVDCALAGLAPFTLGAKEGLALLNGTQVSTALALAGLFAASRTCLPPHWSTGAHAAWMRSKGAMRHLMPRIHASRRQPGQVAVAAELKSRLLAGSRIRASHLRLRQGAGPLLAPLPAAGDGGVP